MTDSPMYPHLLDTDKVINRGYDIKRSMFKWQSVADGRICYSSTNTAAERQFEKRSVIVSTSQTTETDYHAMSESDQALYKTFFEVGGQAAVDAQVATDKRAAETNARIRAINNERVIYSTNGTKHQRDYGMGYND